MECDNGHSAYIGHPLVSPACLRANATTKVVIIYSPCERDTIHLCGPCTKLIKADARRHGYRVETSMEGKKWQNPSHKT